MNATLKAWLRQTSTIHGIGVLVGAGAAAVAYAFTHDAKTAGVVWGSTFGIVCVAMNDNTGDKSSVEQLASDAIQAVVTQRVGAMLPTLGADLVRVFQAATPAVVAVTPAPTPAAPAVVVAPVAAAPANPPAPPQ